MGPRPGRGAALAAALFALLVLYASLYPFAGWRSPGPDGALLLLPWPRYRLPFDQFANFAGYLPLGALVALALRRPGRGWPVPLLAGALLPALLSYATELVQQFLPGRHPSLMDWALNAGGAAAGALLAQLLARPAWARRLQPSWRRWFEPGHGVGLALLLAWPFGLLFPAPVALGLGQIGARLRPWVGGWLDGVAWAQPLAGALAAPPPALALAAPAEATVTMLGLLAPCLVAFSIVPGAWRRMVLAAGATALAVTVLMLSTALSFGPEHALAWVGATTVPALALAASLAVVLAWVPRRAAAGLGLVVTTALVMLVAQAPRDPYFASSLQQWEQGQFVHFHGLAQWVGWLWPYAALAWLLARVARSPRDGLPTIPR